MQYKGKINRYKLDFSKQFLMGEIFLMEKFFMEFGIEPKIIDYGNDVVNMKFRDIERESNMCNNSANRKKKKPEE